MDSWMWMLIGAAILLAVLWYFGVLNFGGTTAARPEPDAMPEASEPHARRAPPPPTAAPPPALAGARSVVVDVSVTTPKRSSAPPPAAAGSRTAANTAPQPKRSSAPPPAAAAWSSDPAKGGPRKS